MVSAIGVGMNQWEMPARFVERLDVDVVLGGGVQLRPAHRSPPGCLVPAPADLLARAQRMREIAASAGYDLAACAFAFAAAHPAVTSVLVGATSAGQVQANLRAFRREVPPDLLHRLVSG
ncbi:aldo/keto reductase [Amycolatopsis sp. lyj-346]|uniref:aldo/keto reductase n=1 Tax=Amycolatopsis sp. lyj-346 TaxID=2789289 RepID=UPI00397BEB00